MEVEQATSETRELPLRQLLGSDRRRLTGPDHDLLTAFDRGFPRHRRVRTLDQHPAHLRGDRGNPLGIYRDVENRPEHGGDRRRRVDLDLLLTQARLHHHADLAPVELHHPRAVGRAALARELERGVSTHLHQRIIVHEQRAAARIAGLQVRTVFDAGTLIERLIP